MITTTVTCDRCGKEIGQPEQRRVTVVNQIDATWSIDLCPPCHTALQEWAKPRPSRRWKK